MSSLLLADTTFESLIQDFPADICRLATENGAFTRSRAVETPVDLLRGVLLYGGLDYSLREVAGNFTQFGRRISDEAVCKRLCGCEGWLRAMLTEMFQVSGKEIEGTGLSRVILIDASDDSGTRCNNVGLPGSSWLGMAGSKDNPFTGHGLVRRRRV